MGVTRRKQHRPGIAPNTNTTHVPTAGSSAALTKPNHTPNRHPRAKGKILLQPVGVTCSILSRGAQCQHAPPPSPPAMEHYLTNSQPWARFRSSNSKHILLIPFLGVVHPRRRRCWTLLKSESRCVIRSTFQRHLSLVFSQKRTNHAKCAHKHVSVDMAQRHQLA